MVKARRVDFINQGYCKQFKEQWNDSAIPTLKVTGLWDIHNEYRVQQQGSEIREEE